MNAYVVYCHPDPGSFTAAIRDRIVAGLSEPASRFECRIYMPTNSTRRCPGRKSSTISLRVPIIRTSRDTATACAGATRLIFVYPTWWSGQPAMLTGWLDRVLLRGVAWELPDGATRITARLTNVRRLVAVTSHGSSKFLNVLEGETGRRGADARCASCVTDSPTRRGSRSTTSTGRQLLSAKHFSTRVEHRMGQLCTAGYGASDRSKVVTTST